MTWHVVWYVAPAIVLIMAGFVLVIKALVKSTRALIDDLQTRIDKELSEEVNAYDNQTLGVKR